MTAFELPPLSTAPQSGKQIALVFNNIPESLDIVAGLEEAATALGWTTIPIIYDPTSATGLQDAFTQAVDANPDGVVTAAVDTTAYAQAAKAFADKNIPVVTSNTTDAINPPVIANVTNADQIKTVGRLTANYVISQEGSNANVAMVNVPSFPILAAYEEGFKNEYLRQCPECPYKSVTVQPGDIGTKVPAQVVSAVQVDPNINFAVMGFGAVATGVSAALKTAGILDVKIVGEAPALGNIEALASGTEDMWVAFPLKGIGWKSMDALARHFNDESTDVSNTSPTPFQILTKDNVKTPAEAPEVVDYQEFFKALWNVG